MDQAMLYGGVVAASLVTLLAVTLLFFTRKTVSFEEAVLQPRKQQQQQAAAATKLKKTTDVRKEKRSEKKKKTATSKKEDEVDGESEPVVAAVTEPAAADPHVGFRVANEVVPLDEEHEQQLAQRPVHADERPKKPILTKRNDQPESGADVRIQQIGRCNSFETVHPKDEYELIKSQLTRDQQKPGSSDEDVRVAEKKVRDGKKKTKSTKVAPAEKLTVRELMDMVKSVALSEEESQLLVNEILNKESETWSQKNDPVAHLKKSVEEKEAQLRTEAENREALKLRVHELRQELAAHKVQAQQTRTQCQQLQQELLKSQTSLRSVADQSRAEQQALQAKLRNEYNAKAAATLSLLKEENSRLKDVVQKMEVDRVALDAIPRLQSEAEQLRGERQQKEVAITHLKQQNDDLVREIAALKEQLNSLSSNKQQEDYAVKQQIVDLQKAVRDREVAVKSAAEELSVTRDRLSQVTGDLEQLQRQHSAELSRVNGESQHLSGENQSLSSQLAESKSQIHQLQMRVQQTEQHLSDAASDFSHKTAAANDELESLRKQYNELQLNPGPQNHDAEERMRQLTEEKQVLGEEAARHKSLLSDLQQEKESVMQFLSSSFSHLNTTSDQDLLSAVDSAIQELRSRIASEPQIESQLEGVRIQNEHLHQEVDAYKQSLTQTDEALKLIESRALDQQKKWDEQLQSERDHRLRISQENEQLLQENHSLQQTIKELQSIQTTVVDMENKLKDLQSKLRGEESAKKDLSDKFDEVSSTDVREASSRASTMREELDRTSKQLQDLSEEKQKVDALRTQMDELQQQLDREKKAGKELQAQNVKLRSLVKIGEDSLKAEMQRNDDLVNQLKLKNGQVHGTAVSTPCLTTNGNDQDSVLSSASSSSLNRDVSTTPSDHPNH